MGLYSSSEGGGIRAANHAPASPRLVCSRDIGVAGSILRGGGLRGRSDRYRCCVEVQQAAAVEHGQCLVTSFHDDNATSGKTKRSMSGVDLQPAVVPTHGPILCDAASFLPR